MSKVILDDQLNFEKYLPIHSLSRLVTHSLIRLLTHSHTNSFTHTLTFSLTCSQTDLTDILIGIITTSLLLTLTHSIAKCIARLFDSLIQGPTDSLNRSLAKTLKKIEHAKQTIT